MEAELALVEHRSPVRMNDFQVQACVAKSGRGSHALSITYLLALLALPQGRRESGADAFDRFGSLAAAAVCTKLIAIR